jgi:hypothetical protein
VSACSSRTMGSSISKSRRVASILVLVCAAAVAGCGDAGDGGGQAAGPSKRSAAASEGARELRAAFRPLRSAPERLPKWLRRQLARLDDEFEARNAQTVGSGGGRYWLIPKGGEACLFEVRQVGAIGQTCTSAANAVSHGFSITSIRPLGERGAGPFKRRVFGVVPDWVRHVWVRTRGRVAEPPVRRGTFNLVGRERSFNPPDVVDTWPRPAFQAPS